MSWSSFERDNFKSFSWMNQPLPPYQLGYLPKYLIKQRGSALRLMNYKFYIICLLGERVYLLLHQTDGLPVLGRPLDLGLEQLMHQLSHSVLKREVVDLRRRGDSG